MPTICRLIRLTPGDAASLAANHASLPERIAAARSSTDVYRYWHGIEFLLAQHRPDSASARWLTLGAQVSAATSDVPGARVLSPDQVQALDAELRDIPPDDLAPHHDAAALDAAQVYPGTWVEWEETFDPLGQLLEHYSFLKEFTAQSAGAGAGMLIHFDVLAEGAV